MSDKPETPVLLQGLLQGFVRRREAFKEKTGIDWRHTDTSIVVGVRKAESPPEPKNDEGTHEKIEPARRF